MKLIKVVTLTLALNGVVTPAQGMEQSVHLHDVRATIQNPITIEKVNAPRVQAAYEAYAHEAQWAPTVRYAALGAVTAITAYGLYYWLKKPKSVTPVLTADSYKNFENLTKQEQKDLTQLAGKIFDLQEAKTKAAEAIIAEKLDKAAKQAQESYAAWFEQTISKTTTSLSNAASSVAGTTSSVLMYGIGATAATTLGSYAYGAVSPFIPTIPTTGNLHWYINARTDYERNVNDLGRYMKNYATLQHEIHDVMQLIVFDIEKIVAYLQHFSTTITAENYHPQYAQLAQATCQRYIKNITHMTNDVVEAFNAEEQLQLIAEKLMFMVSEVNSAKLFVNAYYR